MNAVAQINANQATVQDYKHTLATLSTTFRTTAILEAGRRSLDEQRSIGILYGDTEDPCRPTELV